MKATMLTVRRCGMAGKGRIGCWQLQKKVTLLLYTMLQTERKLVASAVLEPVWENLAGQTVLP